MKSQKLSVSLFGVGGDTEESMEDVLRRLFGGAQHSGSPAGGL